MLTNQLPTVDAISGAGSAYRRTMVMHQSRWWHHTFPNDAHYIFTVKQRNQCFISPANSNCFIHRAEGLSCKLSTRWMTGQGQRELLLISVQAAKNADEDPKTNQKQTNKQTKSIGCLLTLSLCLQYHPVPGKLSLSRRQLQSQAC